MRRLKNDNQLPKLVSGVKFQYGGIKCGVKWRSGVSFCYAP